MSTQNNENPDIALIPDSDELADKEDYDLHPLDDRLEIQKIIAGEIEIISKMYECSQYSKKKENILRGKFTSLIITKDLDLHST